MSYIAVIVGTRPNYMKAFPIYRELKKHNISAQIIHTGQHYDAKMNEVFFNELKIDRPHKQFDMKECTSEAEQLGVIILNLTNYFMMYPPSIVLVFGDVTSSLAGAIVANKMKIKLAHIESGLRSNDRDMPEEINRILIDNLADYLFITEKSGLLHLLEDNIKGEKILVGNTMIDTLVYADKNGLFKNNIMNDKLVSTIKDKYVVVTIHRPSNVDSQLKLEKVIRILNKLSKNYKIIFPMHHRTKARYISLIEFSEANNNPLKLNDDIIITDALGYIEFITLVKNSSLVITDSGGIQEETAFLGIPCVTLRDNTERPSTIDVGANVLSTIDALEEKANKMFDKKLDTQIELWDGKAAERIVKKLSYINS